MKTALRSRSWPGEADAALLPGLTRRSAGRAEETFGWLRDLGPA
ncbi:MAG TPA: hypothetical protein VF933_31600 [Streptosporangiaceae bacterium]